MGLFKVRLPGKVRYM